MRGTQNKRSGASYVSFLLLAGVGTLGYVDWYLYQLRIDISPMAAGASGAQSVPSDSGENLATIMPPQSAAAFPQMVARPMFHPDRRPFVRAKPVVAEVIVPPAPPPPIAKLQLVGIMRTGTNQYRALIRSGVDVPGEWLVVGDQIQGWQLRSIAPDGVTVGVARPANTTTTAAQDFKLRLFPGEASRAG